MSQLFEVPRVSTTQTSLVGTTIAEAARKARLMNRPVLASVTQRVAWYGPIGFFSRGAQVAADRLYWEHPSAGWAMAGIGAAYTFTANGDGRFRAVDTDWRELLAGAVIAQEPGSGEHGGPMLLGGFAFDPQRPATEAWSGFSDALMILPRFLLRSTTSGSWLTTNVVLWPESGVDGELAKLQDERELLLAPVQQAPVGPPERLRVQDAIAAEKWQETVRVATYAIRAGALEKVVLAREVLVEAGAPFDIGRSLRRLRVGYPDCFVFAVARGERCFIGATPERLIKSEKGRVQVTSLAGSIKRGATPEEDEQMGQTLLNSAKNRHEHEVVAAMLRAALAEVCIDVEAPLEPQLLKLRNLQHLYTPLTARMAPGVRLLEVVERLHPTPAVGGAPRDRALNLIRAIEGMDRGWYAAPVGWLDAAGNGEFAVALRSGLVAGATARLFAGCGIVADSDPLTEYEETNLKLRPMMAALGGA